MREDDEETEDQPAEPERKDLRFTEHQDFGVQVRRDMSGGSMWLARGSHTHYSQIHFSSKGRPRDDAPPAAAEAPPEPEPPRPDAAVTPPEEPDPPAAEAGVIAKVRSWFGL